MKRQVHFLVEVGAGYVIVSALLDFFLGTYPVLLWAALAFAFALFSAMIFNALWEGRPAHRSRSKPTPTDISDEYTRLQHLCQIAVESGDPTAAEVLSDRIRTLAFATTAHHLNMTEGTLRSIVQNEPNTLRSKVDDQTIFLSLTTNGPFFQRNESQRLEACLAKIEAWTN